jgi:eukaryotic-like serine/threonine-protein kinase
VIIDPSRSSRNGDGASREEALFHAARLLARPEERAAFLDLACADEPELHGRVEQLFAARAQADAFFDASPGRSIATPPALPAIPDHAPAATQATTDHDLPSRIGRYKLLQKIGEGGCGEVYMAEQEEPVRRLVALKVIKLGMDTRSVISRFEAERQALALMDHPNIAKVLDAGATETGRPYFVMELVRGVKITEYCEQARLNTRDRLELFIKVCQAIQHAHQKAVIHRDIKPSNVLVTLHDGVPVPKVIDFGIAKATQGRLTDHTLFTAFEQFLGAPAYMSPEQAEMSGLDIDTRSDLYSLGVLLYELLTGATPFDTKDLLRAGVDEMRRIIREVEPMRPSTRLTQHSVASKSPITNRKSQINSDLDWIVMKCLEKDRRRRYETANGLAADLWRHLTHEPIVARPPSPAYKLQKAWQRNRLLCSAAGMVVTALVVGLAVSLWQARVAFRARQQAEESRLAETQGRRAAQAAQAVAESERANAQQAADELLETLYAADIRAAYQAVQVNDFALAAALIGKYRPYVPIDDSGPAKNPTEPVARPRDLLGWEWRWLWQLCRSDELDTLQTAPTAARAVLAAHDTLLVTSSNRWLRVTDRDSNEVVATPGGPEAFDSFIDLGAVAFSRDGRYLAAKGGTAVQVWRVGEWQSPYKELEGLANFSMNSAVVFSPDSRTLATRVQGGIGFWDTETWRDDPASRARATGHDDQILTRRRVTGDELLERHEQLGRPADPGCQNARAHHQPGATFRADAERSRRQSDDGGQRSGCHLHRGTPGGSSLRHVHACRGRGFFGSLSCRRLSGWRTQAVRLGHLGGIDFGSRASQFSVRSLAFSPDGSVLATGGKDQVIKIWDVTALAASPGSGQAPKPVKKLRGHHGSILALAFVLDGKKLLSASYDGSVKVWDPFGTDPPGGLPDERRAVWFSPDGRRLITEPYGEGSGLHLWDTATRVKLEPVVPATAGPGYAVRTVSDDGQQAALGSTNGVIDVWNLQTRQRGRRFDAGVDLSMHQLTFSPASGWLAAAPTMLQHPSSEGGLSLWNLEPDAHSPILFSQAFAPFAFCSDDRRMVFARKDGIVEVVDFRGVVRLAQWKAHGAPIHSLALSPDNRLLATGAEDAMVRVWDMASHEKVLELRGHLTGIPAMAFAPDGKTLVTVTWDSTIKFWHLATERELFTVDQFRMVRWSARFSPNGEYLAVNGEDGFGQRQLTLWHAPSWQDIIAAEP